MLNGRFDNFYPTGTSQEPLFALLGTPPEQKRRLVYDSAHNIPRTEMIKEVVNWMERIRGHQRGSASGSGGTSHPKCREEESTSQR